MWICNICPNFWSIGLIHKHSNEQYSHLVYKYEGGFAQVPYGRGFTAAHAKEATVACVCYIYHICYDTEICDMTALCYPGSILTQVSHFNIIPMSFYLPPGRRQCDTNDTVTAIGHQSVTEFTEVSITERTHCLWETAYGWSLYFELFTM